MAAYSLADRFKPYKNLSPDPGIYQFEEDNIKPNKVPFLSKSPRKTTVLQPIWTHAIYDQSIPHRIPNVTSLKSKVKRFPYEDFGAEDIKKILCSCGIEDPCECATAEDTPADEIICQGKVKRRLIKGTPPRVRDPCECKPEKPEVHSPPFYNTRVKESTEFYHGCKWSRWTSKRSTKFLHENPGPADYQKEKKPTPLEDCMERVRHHKRKYSKQLRFIEMVQQLNIREGRPGPATYRPTSPRGTDLLFMGPKSDRFPSMVQDSVGPADHWIRRDLDPLPTPEKECLARLPEPACFGRKSIRFVPEKEEGPSPASYEVSYTPGKFQRCPRGAFGISSVRFKPDIEEESEEESCEEETPKTCRQLSSSFKSKTIRFKPLIKKENEASPADLQLRKTAVQERSFGSQYTAPFHASEARFQPWHNWIGCVSSASTNDRFLNLEKPKCPPAVNWGPMVRSERFPMSQFITPAPNEYKILGAIDNILKTHNSRLSDNIEKQHKFVWNPPEEIVLTAAQKEELLLQKCIDMLDEQYGQEPEPEVKPKRKRPEKKGKKTIVVCTCGQAQCLCTAPPKKKLLRFFLYSHSMPFI